MGRTVEERVTGGRMVEERVIGGRDVEERVVGGRTFLSDTESPRRLVWVWEIESLGRRVEVAETKL